MAKMTAVEMWLASIIYLFFVFDLNIFYYVLFYETRILAELYAFLFIYTQVEEEIVIFYGVVVVCKSCRA